MVPQYIELVVYGKHLSAILRGDDRCRKYNVLSNPLIHASDLEMLTLEGIFVSLVSHLRSLHCAISPDQLAKLLGVSRRSIYDAVKAGELPYFHLRSSIKFDPGQVADWLEAQMPTRVHVLAAAHRAKEQ